MDKLIQPLADILKAQPELSAKVIILLSVSFTSMAGFYALLQEQAKKNLKDQLEGHQEAKKELSNNIQKITQLNQIRANLEESLEELKKEVKGLKNKNQNLETQQKISRLENKLVAMVVSTQKDIQDLDKAIATQGDRIEVFQNARRRRRKKRKIFFGLLNRR